MHVDGLVGVSLADDEQRNGKQLVGSLCLDLVQKVISIETITDGCYGITLLMRAIIQENFRVIHKIPISIIQILSHTQT